MPKPRKTVDPAAVLLEARSALALKQHVFAKELGVVSRTLGRWELGLSAPRGDLLTRLIEVLARHDVAHAAKVAAAFGTVLPPALAPAPRPDAPRIEALDAAVYLAADALSVAAPALRPVLARFLLHVTASGLTPDEARARLTR